MESTSSVSFPKNTRNKKNRVRCKEYYHRVLKHKRIKNPEPHRLAQKKYYAKNRDKQIAYIKQWRLEKRKQLETKKQDFPVQSLPETTVVKTDRSKGDVCLFCGLSEHTSVCKMSGLNSISPTNLPLQYDYNEEDPTDTTIVASY